MSEPREQNTADTPRAEARAIILLRAGGQAFAVYADECECVTPWTEPAPLPHAPGAVLGVASIRGRMRTVLDPARLLESSNQERESRPTLIASLAGDEQLALACESSATAALGADDYVSPPTSPSFPTRGSFRHGDETVQLLDPARLFDAAMSGTERRRQRVVNREP